MTNSHTHEVVDNRGRRAVFVDGNLVSAPIYADTKRGVVKCHKVPLETDASGEALKEDVIYGTVTVEFLHD